MAEIKMVRQESVKVPKFHDNIFDDADSSSRERTTIRQRYDKDRKKV